MQANAEIRMTGVPAILAGVGAMATGDALLKLLASERSLSVLISARSILAVILLLILQRCLSRGGESARRIVRTKFVALIMIRSVLLAVMWLCYYAALPRMNLSLAAAVFYLSPLFISLGSVLLGIERFGLNRVIAVVAGFSGALIALAPWGVEVNRFALLPLAAAILYAAAQLLTQQYLREVSALTLAWSMNAALFGVALVAMQCGLSFWDAMPPGVEQVADLSGYETVFVYLALAVLISITAALTAIAFQTGQPSVIGAFDYAYLLFAGFWGWYLFGELPSASQAVGMVLIVASGMCLLPMFGRFMAAIFPRRDAK